MPGQLATEEKSNEIAGLPELLKVIAVRGNTITIDVMGCQKGIVQQITTLGGDYAIALKGNQETLLAEAENFFLQAMDVGPEGSNCDVAKSVEENRGRVEEREVWARPVDRLEERFQREWANLRNLVCVRSWRTHRGKSSEELRYYSSSLPAKAECLGSVIRRHWCIENTLHWQLSARTDAKYAQLMLWRIFSLARKRSRTLLRADTSQKLSVPNKRKLLRFEPRVPPKDTSD